MHKLLINPDIELSIQFMITLPGSFPEKIIKNGELICQSVEIKQISARNNREKIIELRLEDVTVTAYYNEGETCHTCYLFPDTEKNIPDYIEFFNHHYTSINSNEWVDTEHQLLIQVTDDEDVGSILSCTKSNLYS